ncbi:HAD-IB family hydrolase [Streptomyces sp. NPDC050617]|uniref:HAD family hydrolase n=1 Tax=Streptomyces sp. NPDC050617 TaxID=3154628 RepID=UPI00342C2FE3
MEPRPAGLAFFDADETLITVKSMFDFYDFFLDAVGHTPQEQERLHQEARDLLRPGLPRAQGNRLFYRRFAGYRAADVARVGRAWFDRRLARGGFFHQDVLAALRAHRAAGRTTVVLSGSFPAPLDPVVAYAGADVLVSTRLEVRDGVYTGEVLRTMIGDAKAETARQLIADAGAAAADCHAYGDHGSDLGLLSLVGHPVVVGANPELTAAANAHGWHRLAGVAAA